MPAPDASVAATTAATTAAPATASTTATTAAPAAATTTGTTTISPIKVAISVLQNDINNNITSVVQAHPTLKLAGEGISARLSTTVTQVLNHLSSYVSKKFKKVAGPALKIVTTYKTQLTANMGGPFCKTNYTTAIADFDATSKKSILACKPAFVKDLAASVTSQIVPLDAQTLSFFKYINTITNTRQVNNKTIVEFLNFSHVFF